MEEAWELAVVSDQSEDDVVNNKILSTWDWSPKHTRLRYQLFISSLAFLLISIYPVVSVSFPFGFISFADGLTIPVNIVRFIALGFLIFTCLSFIMRTSVENRRLDMTSPSYQSEFLSLKENLENLKSGFEAYTHPKIEVLKRLVGELPPLETSGLMQLSTLNKNVEILLAEKQDLLDQYAKLNEMANTAGYTSSNQPPYGELPKQYRQEINQRSLFLKSLNNEIMNDIKVISNGILGATLEDILTIPSLAESIRKNYIADRDALIIKFGSKISNIDSAISLHHSELGKKFKLLSFDRNVLGYWVPLFASLLMVLSGLIFWASPSLSISMGFYDGASS